MDSRLRGNDGGGVSVVGDWTLVAVLGFHPLSCPLPRRGREDPLANNGEKTIGWKGPPVGRFQPVVCAFSLEIR